MVVPVPTLRPCTKPCSFCHVQGFKIEVLSFRALVLFISSDVARLIENTDRGNIALAAIKNLKKPRRAFESNKSMSPSVDASI